MAIAQVNAGDRINASDLNAFYALLKGVAASGENVTLIYNAGALTFQPSSDPSAGTRVLTIKNNAGTTLFAARYDGLLEMLSAAAAPGSPVAGSVYWDTLLAAFRVYDGTNWRDMAGGSGGPNPNLVLNSDFSRRTVFGLAMPEVFADLSGTTKIDGGAAGAVAANIFTQGAANNEYAWCAGSFVWRDGRASATFKATAIAGIYQLKFRESATTWLSAKQNNGNFTITSSTATADVVRATVANVLTINQWYWIELEVQGTTIVGKIYSTGTTTAGTVKASGTLVQTLSFTGVTASAGSSVSITSDQAAAQWGGIATGNGGVYVETWLPESWTLDFDAGSVRGGTAFGFDESADSGPVNKQWTPRVYIPAITRALHVYLDTPDGSVNSSTAYAGSFYEKTSGLGGSGTVVRFHYIEENSALAVQATNAVNDAADASWTRKTIVATSAAGTRRARIRITVNPDATRTGTAYFMLPQLEQGAAATSWRNAPADDAPIVWELVDAATTPTTTGAAEVNSRDNAGNLFFPWDCTLHIDATGTWSNSGTNTNSLGATLDGAFLNTNYSAVERLNTATFASPVAFSRRTTAAAGKHRIALAWTTSAGTATMLGTSAPTAIRVTAYRGK